MNNSKVVLTVSVLTQGFLTTKMVGYKGRGSKDEVLGKTSRGVGVGVRSVRHGRG